MTGDNSMNRSDKPVDQSTTFDRLVSVEVLGLFGMFDHWIPLNRESNITVIFGPNGVGKTIVLQMIREALSGKSELLSRIPFERFELAFQSGDRVAIFPDTDNFRGATDQRRGVLYEALLNSETYRGEFYEYNPAVAQRVTEALGAPWQYIGDGQWRDPRDGEIIESDGLMGRVNLPLKVLDSLYVPDATLNRIHNKCNVHFVGTDRLTTEDLGSSEEQERRLFFDDAARANVWRQSRRAATNKTIEVFSEDLKKRIRKVLSEYGKLTEQLDRSLVKRLLSPVFKRRTSTEVLQRFKELDDTRRRLTSLGLLTMTEDVLGRAGDDDVLKLVSESIDVFSLYVLDMEQKLALFNDLSDKVEILLERTNQRFKFKRLTIDPADGFVFVSDIGTKLSGSDLSSGEQHEMILFYELLFETTEGDLVLIDEPEISLHAEWQLDFLNDLRIALSSSKTQVLLATHSAAIAQGAEGSLIPLGVPRDV